ncbi:hypothetical protein jhhlp_008087 [Lomentospora prolificans]|uniref:Tetraspanin n=1 Tax=Lomentospora prolificans TaxID=41688 RepID=A0A2N3MZG8_9PEZI|nr:hypothetical protein jhhlp_008087 [Lomentospora prolificans]
MHKPLYFYGLIIICLCLTGVAVASFVTTRNLALPISKSITILPIILPVLFPLMAVLLRRTLNSATSLPLLLRILPRAHFILLSILATLLSQPLAPNPTDSVPCPLITHWQSLYSSHDSTTIRRIQDTLECCGLRSSRDMAWPFDPNGGKACVDMYRRDKACGPLWEGSLKSAAGADLGVVLGLAILQVIITYFTSDNPPSWLPSFGGRSGELATRNNWRLISQREAEEAVEDNDADSDTEANRISGEAQNGTRDYGTIPGRARPEDSDALHTRNAWRD